MIIYGTQKLKITGAFCLVVTIMTVGRDKSAILLLICRPLRESNIFPP